MEKKNTSSTVKCNMHTLVRHCKTMTRVGHSIFDLNFLENMHFWSSSYQNTDICLSFASEWMVEEKKKRALEKNEARLKWEQKLEAPARAKSDVEAREKVKAAKHKRKSDSSDFDTDNVHGRKKSTKKHYKKHRKHITLNPVIQIVRKRNPNKNQREDPQTPVMIAVRIMMVIQKKREAERSGATRSVGTDSQIIVPQTLQMMML